MAGPIIRMSSFLLNFTVFEGFLSSRLLFNIPGDDKFDRVVDILSLVSSLLAAPLGICGSKNEAS